jgi:hypothetical protein
MTPQRIQRRRAAGWRMPPGAIYVGRPTRWGNPFQIISIPARLGGPLHRVHDAGRRVPALSSPYDMWITDDLLGAYMFAVRTYELHIGPGGRYEWDDPEAMLTPLRGRDLACWCPPTRPCHADVLLRLANGWAEE